MRHFSLFLSVMLFGISLHAADTIEEAFANGIVSGQIRLGSIYDDPRLDDETTRYATALGGQLRYETAKYHGLDIGVAFYTSHDVQSLSGESEEGRRDTELSSEAGHYDLLAEAYIDYTYGDFTVRIGRQRIDTPFADSDDIRMTPNTFEAAFATYAHEEFMFIAAYLTRWQGPDSESEYRFVDLAEDSDGLFLGAVTYASDALEAGVWYYDEEQTASILYADLIVTYTLPEVGLSGGVQFADQREQGSSGIGATLYGAIAGVEYGQFTLGAAYNSVDVEEGHEFFGGFGGGAAFVNMDETTAGALSLDQDVVSWKFSAGYDLETVGIPGLTIEYAYGDYDGQEHSRIHEQDVVLAYAPIATWDVELIYAHIRDGEKDLGVDHSGHPADSTFDRLLARVNFDF